MRVTFEGPERSIVLDAAPLAQPDLIAPAPRGVPADVRELRAMRYGSPRD